MPSLRFLFPGVGLLIGCAFLLAACDFSTPEELPPQALTVPEPWPLIPIPAHNPYTEQKAELGRRLFFDPILSGDGSISCASCHRPELAFTDGERFSPGANDLHTLRNTPSLFAVAYQRGLNWDGGAATLEIQSIVPLEAENEMDADLGEILQRLDDDPEYRALFYEAFGTGPSVQTLTQALATFQRTILPTGSPYDRFLTSNEHTLSAEQRLGQDLFFGRAGCATCHSGVRLTDDSFRQNGLTPRDEDPGRGHLSGRPEDMGLFKVPSLRNVAITAPYMHDGRFDTLDQVVRHYESGGENPPNQDPAIRPLSLTDAERRAIVAFLHSLTDDSFR